MECCEYGFGSLEEYTERPRLAVLAEKKLPEIQNDAFLK
jgi:hypothetical protein